MLLPAALCLLPHPPAAQMLGSVATLMHETYLPVYLSDVLHLSNTKVGSSREGGLGLGRAAN